MKLRKDQLAILNQLKKKIAKADSSSEVPVVKDYVFKITAGHLVRSETVKATSKSEAEDVMFQKYGDLPYELVEVK